MCVAHCRAGRLQTFCCAMPFCGSCRGTCRGMRPCSHMHASERIHVTLGGVHDESNCVAVSAPYHC